MKSLHVFNRREIMREAWRIARRAREDAARKAHREALNSLPVIAGKIRRPDVKSYEAFLAETPLDLGAAMKLAWAEAKRDRAGPPSGAVIVIRGGNSVARVRGIRSLRVWPILLTAARYLGDNFLRSRV